MSNLTLIPTDERVKNYERASYQFTLHANGVAVGTAIVHAFGSGMSYVTNLAYLEVDSEHRRKGYASTALQILKERFGTIALFAKAEAAKLYTDAGFRRIKRSCAQAWWGSVKKEYGDPYVYENESQPWLVSKSTLAR